MLIGGKLVNMKDVKYIETNHNAKFDTYAIDIYMSEETTLRIDFDNPRDRDIEFKKIQDNLLGSIGNE
jgi:hypothetical protein